jgi:CBS domain-containing protein
MTRTVRDIMAEDLKVAAPEMQVSDAAALMAHYDIGSLPVASDDGALKGIVTDRDLVLRVLATRADPTAVTVGDIATMRSVVTVSPEASLEDAMAAMADNRVKRLPVLQDDALIGIVSIGDLANATSVKETAGETIAAILSSISTTTSRAEGRGGVGAPGPAQEVRDAR